MVYKYMSDVSLNYSPAAACSRQEYMIEQRLFSRRTDQLASYQKAPVDYAID